ncbi:RyR domain-containing protein [Parasporobacterium paucivorans]|uniref:RyR domain-containing protein n=1 Tax=Parasporobacterium paucivorans DSM 15970 TaxID=1122934 RepID=A0A1M6JYS0_9FIRM|nr:RyR domain-containing protein [Parasporobacterium paucivorans]SHJ51782.1 RyR domain-containing protein [Parasporobacterium paucivorans DSM 15970]
MHIPEPVDTSDVILPDDIARLNEWLAENVHNIWAAGRLADGWTYGGERNDEAKTHPCLVPYSELPESEKEYDRNTALETLKLIIKLGYKIIPD